MIHDEPPDNNNNVEHLKCKYEIPENINIQNNTNNI